MTTTPVRIQIDIYDPILEDVFLPGDPPREVPQPRPEMQRAKPRQRPAGEKPKRLRTPRRRTDTWQDYLDRKPAPLRHPNGFKRASDNQYQVRP